MGDILKKKLWVLRVVSCVLSIERKADEERTFALCCSSSTTQQSAVEQQGSSACQLPTRQ